MFCNLLYTIDIHSIFFMEFSGVQFIRILHECKGLRIDCVIIENIDDCMNSRTNERTYERANERMNEWMSDTIYLMA